MKNKKQWLGGVLLVGLIALTAFLLLRGQSMAELGAAMKKLKPGYLSLGLGLMFLFVGCEAMCSKLILGRLGYQLPYRRCFGFSMVGFYVSSITPSATGGQPAQIYYMGKNGVKTAHGALNMMMIAVCYQVVILLYAVVAAAARPGLIPAMGKGMGALLLYGTAVMLALTGGMLSLMFRPNAARRLLLALLGLGARMHLIKDRAAAERRLEGQIEEYRKGADCFRANRDLTPWLLGLSLVQLTALFLVPFVVYKAMGLSGYGAFDLVCAQALLTLATSSLPLPGAVGATEGGFVRCFAMFFGEALVTPAVLASRGISFYAFLVISGIATFAVHLGVKGRAAQKHVEAAGTLRLERKGREVPAA